MSSAHLTGSKFLVPSLCLTGNCNAAAESNFNVIGLLFDSLVWRTCFTDLFLFKNIIQGFHNFSQSFVFLYSFLIFLFSFPVSAVIIRSETI